MNMDSIVKIMNRDHGHLTKLLIRLERTDPADRDALNKSFNDFRWELERHFVTEEKAIFIYLDEEAGECHTQMLDLLKEHEAILKMLKGLEMQLKAKDALDLDGFSTMLSKHRDFEDEVFYPRLESELTKEQKNEIVKGIQSPV